MNKLDKCPDCGSVNAVSKSVAWDAASETPKKVQRELDHLRQVSQAALRLSDNGDFIADEENVGMIVSSDKFSALIEALGLRYPA